MRASTPRAGQSGIRPPVLRHGAVAYAAWLCIGTLALGAGLPGTALAQEDARPAQGARRSYDIPAGALAPALSSLASSANVLLTFTPEQTSGKTTAGIRGQYTVQEALAALLAHSGLNAVRMDNGGYVLRAAPASPAAPAAPPRPTEAPASTLPTVRVTALAEQSPGELPPVYAGGQVARGARLGLLGNADVMDTPFSVTSYTAEAIENQGARTVANVLRNDASVRFSTSDGHPFENFRIRNFAVNQNEMTVDGMYGLMPYGHTPVEMFERVELLRGPSALFSGMAPAGALGGTINLVPKRAGPQPLSRVSLDYIGESQFGTRLDLGRRFGPDDAVGLRVNGSFADGDTELDGQSKQRQFLSAALDYRNGGFKGSLDAYYSKEKFDGGTPAGIFFRNAALGLLPAPDAGLNLFPAAYGEAENKAAILRAEYAFNDMVTAYANVGVRRGTVAGFFTGSWIVATGADGTGTASMSGQRMYEKNVSAETGLRLNFRTGGVGHAMVLQASRLKMDYGYDANSNGGVTNIYHPVPVAMPDLPASARKWSDKTFDSLALIDTLSMLDDRLRLTLGLRHQSFEVDPTADGISTGGEVAYDKSVVTPAVGVVFKPWGPNVSLYASYVQGLSQGASISTTNGYVRNHTFAPYKTEQGEIGVKWNAGTFTNTFALFQITQPTLITFTDGSGAMDATDGGEKRVRGLEWNTFGEITRGLRVLGGVVYAQSVQTRTQGGLLDGYAAVGSPRWQANLGAEWDVPGAPGLTLTGRVETSSPQWLTNNHTLRLPGWGVFDLGARYATRLYGKNATLRLNVANVAGRSYYSGIFREGAAIATLGAPRTVSASLTVDF
ncbi:TonB-dependent siderophore receptor [Pseudorhodoferax sp.]|uniref:TonB-dependent siderophore receptor n=1 Tax=Pseudorhodoferax sp. TaxID=1993553 RepID=UPI0039E5BB42